ncbi:MAG: IclR family transcriptional regulator [Rhizobiaceae bacterium]
MGTITKALTLLNNFSSQQPQIGLTEFARLARRDKATVHRHLTALEQNGFVEQDPISKNYRLGPALLRLAAVREHTFPIRDAVISKVTALSDELGELVHVSLLQGDMMSPLLHADTQSHGTRVHFDDGEMLPLHATSSGIAMLSYGPSELLQRVLANPMEIHTSKTITEGKTLCEIVEETRSRGYSYSDQGFEEEVCSFAAPVFDHNQQTVGTVAVALPKSRLTSEKGHEIVMALLKYSEIVSSAFGGVVPNEIKQVWPLND